MAEICKLNAMQPSSLVISFNLNANKQKYQHAQIKIMLLHFHQWL